MDIIVAMFSAIGTVITNFISQLGSALTGVTALFWVEGTGETSGHLTVLGVLLLVAVGVALVYFAFNLIRSLIRRA